jgi:hypothetical protein
VTLIPFRKFYKKLFEFYGDEIITNGKSVFKIFGFTRGQVLSLPYRACIIATLYLTLREFLSLFYITSSFKHYFKKKSNYFKVVMIIMSWTSLYAYNYCTVEFLKSHMTIPSSFIIIFGENRRFDLT